MVGTKYARYCVYTRHDHAIMDGRRQQQQQQYVGGDGGTYYPPNTTHTTTNKTGPRAKCDQVVFEAIAKAAEIVVASRCWLGNSTNGTTTVGPGNNSAAGSGRFNLLVPEVQSVRYVLFFIFYFAAAFSISHSIPIQFQIERDCQRITRVCVCVCVLVLLCCDVL